MIYKCRCSERPLGIIASRVAVDEEKEPWQILIFACTNKECSEYKKPVVEKHINLFDNGITKIIDLRADKPSAEGDSND